MQKVTTGLTGDEMFAIGARIPPHADELGPDLTDQSVFLFAFHNSQSPLQNIIYMTEHRVIRQDRSRLTGKLVLHHCDNWTDTILLGCHDLINQVSPTFRVSADESLFAYIGRKLVPCHL